MKSLRMLNIVAAAAFAGAVTPAAAQTVSVTSAVNAIVQQACLSSTNSALLNTYAGTLVLAAAGSSSLATYINTQVSAGCPGLQAAFKTASSGQIQLSANKPRPVTPNKGCDYDDDRRRYDDERRRHDDCDDD